MGFKVSIPTLRRKYSVVKERGLKMTYYVFMAVMVTPLVRSVFRKEIPARLFDLYGSSKLMDSNVETILKALDANYKSNYAILREEFNQFYSELQDIVRSRKEPLPFGEDDALETQSLFLVYYLTRVKKPGFSLKRAWQMNTLLTSYLER